jgi:hypothetical protein
LTLGAILKPDPSHKPKLREFTHVDLSTRKGRITNMRWLINLSFLLPELVNLMPPGQAEYKPMKGYFLFVDLWTVDRYHSCRDGCTVELLAHHVVKTYTRSDAVQKVEHLQRIYRHLEERGVPNTDSLHYSSGGVVVLQPRGHLVKPKTEKELLEVVSCVLKVLKVSFSLKLKIIVE